MEQFSLFPEEEQKEIVRTIHRDWTGNYHSVCGMLGAANETKEDREENDYYATDPIAAEWLCEIEALDKNIWECACGQGHLGKVFEKNGYNVKATDLINRGYGQGGVDFLKCSDKWHGDIVTNPPYKFAQEFIEKALELVDDGHLVCMFLKVQFLEGISRRKLYNATPPRTIWVSSSRIQCGKNGNFQGSMIAYAWYIWEKGYTGDTILKWFN